MEVQYNNDAKYDFHLREFNITFPIDDVFHSAEKNGLLLMERICNGLIEVKDHNKSMETGNLFIEFKIDKKGNGKFEESGLRLTKADFYLFNIGSMAIFTEVNLLKYCFNNRKILNLRIADNRYEKDHIGYGLLIPIGRLPFLQKKYEDFLNSR